MRAKQDLLDHGRSTATANGWFSVPKMLHGDAAFAGQVYADANLANSGYRVGGTIHIIVNNQIGFTTAPEYSRSSEYYTDRRKDDQHRSSRQRRRPGASGVARLAVDSDNGSRRTRRQ